MGKRKEITSKDNGKQKMWIIITVIIVFFAMAGYAGMSYYYSDRFFRGTTINGINCSGKTSEEAEQAVAKKAEDYLLEVKARNLKSQSINGKLIGYRYVSDGSISQYLDEQKPYKWVRGFWKKQNYTAKENMTYDKVKLKEQMEKLEDAFDLSPWERLDESRAVFRVCTSWATPDEYVDQFIAAIENL